MNFAHTHDHESHFRDRRSLKKTFLKNTELPFKNGKASHICEFRIFQDIFARGCHQGDNHGRTPLKKRSCKEAK